MWGECFTKRISEGLWRSDCLPARIISSPTNTTELPHNCQMKITAKLKSSNKFRWQKKRTGTQLELECKYDTNQKVMAYIAYTEEWSAVCMRIWHLHKPIQVFEVLWKKCQNSPIKRAISQCNAVCERSRHLPGMFKAVIRQFTKSLWLIIECSRVSRLQAWLLGHATALTMLLNQPGMQGARGTYVLSLILRCNHTASICE